MARRAMGSEALVVILGLVAAGCTTRSEPITAKARGPTSRSQAPASDVWTGQTRPASVADQPQSWAPLSRSPATVLSLSPEPFTITADDPGVQLLVTRRNSDATARDLTSQARWRVEPPGAAAIEPGGYLRPVKHGTLSVHAAIDGQEAVARIVVEPRQGRSWSFAEDIVPALTRLGCNAGSCHGKAEGQNGFHLSLAGYDPEGDYQALVRDQGQRRISLLDPEQSLFLTKATGRTPHVGGPRVAAGSPEYRLLLDWLKAGAPRQFGKSHGKVDKLTVEPGTVHLSEPGNQQLRVVAHYADGHRRDVTRLAVFKVNDDASSSVSPLGKAVLLRRAEADVIVRYETHVESVRLSTVINPGLAFDFASLPRRNLVDRELWKRLEALKVPPSPPASDPVFLRRVSLDLTGEQPTPEQIRAFLADKAPDKRVKLVDTLLARPDHIYFWLVKLGDLLQISPAQQGNSTYRYQEWVRHCLSENTRWDVVVTKLLTSLGDPNDPETGGPVNYALGALEPNVQAEQTAQRFLGIRLRCAQCHDHPFDIWTQDDYWGLAAIFAKVQRTGNAPATMMNRASVAINPNGKVIHPRTKQPARPRLLGGKLVEVAGKDDPRVALARWMTAPENPYFARATVNWVWAQFFGKGLVDPAGELSRANPPVHPELLDALGRHFVETKYNLRDLIRTIATSEAYGLSSTPLPGNERDQRLFSRQIPRPLTAHQMADALAQATDVPNVYGTAGARLSIRVNDPAAPSAVLDAFGRCTRAASCSSVQTPPLSLKQALLLIGGDIVESKIGSLNGYLASALKLDLEPEELVENLYMRTVCRPPTAEEASRWSAELKQGPSLSEAAEDLFWALLNSREFAFNH
ncbi:MAG: DUF1549 and DUF1553 domain-containing protein [Isosphaeraceae bacterium]